MKTQNNPTFGMAFIRPAQKDFKNFYNGILASNFSEATCKRGLEKIEQKLQHSKYDVRFNVDSYEVVNKNGEVLESYNDRKTKFPGVYERNIKKYEKKLDASLNASEFKKSWLALKAVCSMIYDSVKVKLFKPEESLPDALRLAVKRAIELEKQ